MGKRKTEGWARKVLRIPWCQQAMRPIRKPGMKKSKTAMAAPTGTAPAGGSQDPSTAAARAKPLLTRVRPQAKKMRTNRGERSPPRHLFCSGRIRHGPTFKLLARPRDDVKTDVVKATKNMVALSGSYHLKISS